MEIRGGPLHAATPCSGAWPAGLPPKCPPYWPLSSPHNDAAQSTADPWHMRMRSCFNMYQK